MIRILLLAFLFYLWFLIIRGFQRRPNRLFHLFKKTLKSRQTPRTTEPKNPRVIDEMKPCANCGTYNPTQTALMKKGLYFCNTNCQKRFATKEKQ